MVEDPSAISEIVTHKDRLLWLDLESPTAQEFELLREEFGLHPLAIEDAMARHQRPKIDTYESFYLAIFYAVSLEQNGAGRTSGRSGLRGTDFLKPANTGNLAAEMLGPGTTNGIERGAGETAVPPVKRGDQLDAGQNDLDERIVLSELTLFLGQNFLITVHDHPIIELDEAAKRWTRNIESISKEIARPHNLPGTRQLTPDEKANLTAQSPPQNGQGTQPPSVLDTQPIPVEVSNRPLKLSPPSEEGQAGDDSKGHHEADIGILVYSLLDTIVDSYFPVIDSIVERIEDLEESIFERYSQKSIESIFTLKKDLLALRKVLAPERDVLNILTRRDISIFDSHTIVYFQDVYDHVVRVTDSIDTYRDLLSSALDSFLSMQSNRLNITVQTLTAVSIMLMSVAAFTGWYGMNFQMMPELGTAWGYPGVMIVVATVLVAEFIFFKRKGWL